VLGAPRSGDAILSPISTGATMDRNNLFRKFAQHTANGVGSPWAFASALLVVLAWGMTGPIFHYSDTWQLVINTSTTIVTFLMVFLIQTTQNRDATAIHLKLDELIRAMEGARNQLVDLDSLSDQELDKLKEEFHKLGAEHSPVIEGVKRVEAERAHRKRLGGHHAHEEFRKIAQKAP
jgi:low affinity Fe/Cu permease